MDHRRTPEHKVGASKRWHKALPGVRRQLGRSIGRLRGKKLAPRNGSSRLCRERGANSGAPPAGSGAKSWRLETVAQGFPGSEAPTRADGRRLLIPGNKKTAEPEALLVTPRALPQFPDVLWPCRFGCESHIRSPGSVSSRRYFSSRRRTGFP